MVRVSRFPAPLKALPVVVCMIGLSLSVDPCAAGARPSVVGSPTAIETTDPLVVVVSLRRQRLRVYDAHGVVAESSVSSGQPDYPTPTGVFSVIGKEVEHESNLYEGAAMPFMQRLTWTGTAMHAGNLPGYAASHGCIRLSWGFSKRLFDMTQMNTRVVVTHDDPTPQPISHPRLFMPAVDPTPEIDSALVPSVPSRVASLVDVSPAMAAPTAPILGPNQLALTAKGKARFAATAQLGAAVRQAEDERAALMANIKTANRALEAARADKESLENAIADAAAEAGKLERAKKSAQNQLAALQRRADAARTPAQVDAVAHQEDAAEARLADVIERHEEAVDAVASLPAGLPALDDQLAIAQAARHALDDQLHAATLAVKTAQSAFSVARREDARYLKPVSVLISRKNQRMYVRQGFEPVMDVPVAIENPEVPLGTHVFTAMAVKGGSTLDWTVISLTSPGSRGLDAHAEPRRKGAVKASPTALAAKALDRVTLPPEAAAAISEVVKPGSSLIISDEGTSQYFGAGTDLTVITD